MALADAQGLASIAFPSISTGAYRFPIEQAARIAISTVRERLSRAKTVRVARFVCFSEPDRLVYQAALDDNGMP
jgi:O-acetyl-ADP-ribose deacetylase (regulator of RNase III)